MSSEYSFEKLGEKPIVLLITQFFDILMSFLASTNPGKFEFEKSVDDRICQLQLKKMENYKTR